MRACVFDEWFFDFPNSYLNLQMSFKIELAWKKLKFAVGTLLIRSQNADLCRIKYILFHSTFYSKNLLNRHYLFIARTKTFLPFRFGWSFFQLTKAYKSRFYFKVETGSYLVETKWCCFKVGPKMFL